MIKAIGEEFPDTRLSGCYFHLRQRYMLDICWILWGKGKNLVNPLEQIIKENIFFVNINSLTIIYLIQCWATNRDEGLHAGDEEPEQPGVQKQDRGFLLHCFPAGRGRTGGSPLPEPPHEEGIYLSICICIHLSIYLSVSVSIYLFIYLSVSVSIYLSIYLSICICIHLSICLDFAG